LQEGGFAGAAWRRQEPTVVGIAQQGLLTAMVSMPEFYLSSMQLAVGYWLFANS